MYIRLPHTVRVVNKSQHTHTGKFLPGSVVLCQQFVYSYKELPDYTSDKHRHWSGLTTSVCHGSLLTSLGWDTITDTSVWILAKPMTLVYGSWNFSEKIPGPRWESNPHLHNFGVVLYYLSY